MLHEEAKANTLSEPFIKGLQDTLGLEFDYKGEDFSTYGLDEDVDLIYVRTGGTEGIFKKVFCSTGKPVIPGGKKVRLLTSGLSNSLAASMEILSYLNNNNIPAEILHGSSSEIAAMLDGSVATDKKSFHKTISSKGVLAGKRLGVVGHPSDWLISSDVDYSKAKEVLGVELVDISIDELVEEVNKGGYSIPECLNPMNTPKFGRPISGKDMQVACDVYGALKKLIAKYSLDGLTLRCFDLLTRISNTGCLALALLNSEGYVATCEGDVPTMLSMAVAKAVCGQPGFQVNLSHIGGSQLLFAHCTVPLNMIKSYVYDTHFESGIGVAIHGEFEPSKATIFKMGAGLDSFIVEDVELTENCYANNLCRTQIHIDAPGFGQYFLTEPLGNHHVVLLGNNAEKIETALKAN